MKNPSDNYQLLQLMLKAQSVARREGDRTEGGYAMVIASVLTIFLFALLTAYLNISNINKSATNAYVDGTNTFYAAESALNKRVSQIRKKFDGYSLPEGTSPGTADANSITNCFNVAVNVAPSNNDFECRNYTFNSNSKGLQFNSTGSNLKVGDKNDNTGYIAYTFVVDRTNYDTTTNPKSPFPVKIPAGQTYAGMNAQEYRYTIFAYAAKPGTDNSPVSMGDAKTVLQMDFKSRIVPLFQFGAFYDGDLEINPSAPMTIDGWVQTNSNLYIEPTPYTSNPAGDLVFQGNVSAGGDIYNRVDAASFHRPGVTMVQMPSSNLPLTTGSTTTNLFAYNPHLSPFNGKVANGSNGGNVLAIPDAGLLRKRNYLSKEVGDYFAKADLRLEAVPGRAIPFDFVSIQNGAGAAGGACDTSKPTADNDPDPLYIDSLRQGTGFKCSKLSKGQLVSLQQPVLVLTRGNTTEETRFCQAAPTGEIDRLRDIIDYANVTVDPTMDKLSPTKQDKVLRALSLAISSSRTVLDYSYINKWSIQTDVPSVMDTFGTLLADPTFNIDLKPGQINALKAAKPAAIAKARQSCFLPAPTQLIGNIPAPNIASPTGGGGGGGGGAPSPENPAGYFRRIDASKRQKTARRFLAYVAGTNPGNFGNNTFGGPNPYVPVPWAIYDRREQRWMSTIQINIESMAIWNRDGRFVNFLSNTNLNSATDAPTSQELTDALNGGNPSDVTALDSYSGNGLLFVRAAASGSGSTLASLGLAAADRTDNGLVFHATVNDNAGGVAPATSIPIVKTNPDKSTTPVDYYRTEFGGDTQKSMYAFAIAGGKELPAPMTIASDRAIYLQGNYNLASYNKQPAAIMGDTISALSVNCLSPGGGLDPRFQRTANINCVYPDDTFVHGRPSPWTNPPETIGNTAAMSKADDTTYNTAFLSFTIDSCGNQGIDRACTSGPRYSGGLNNYVRLLEDWRTKNLNYRGSMVSLGTPLESNGVFIPAGQNNSYFGIPNRNFSYDTSFDSYLGLPPLTPKVVYLQQEVFKRG